MHTAVVINHKAGSAHLRDVELQRLFNNIGWQVTVYAVKPKQLRSKLQYLCKTGVKTIIVGGGDGTLNTAADVLINVPQTVTLGVLPLGTFNLFAHDINMPLDLTEAVEALQYAHPQQIDLGSLNGHIFLNKASIGLHPFAIEVRRLYQKKWGLPKPFAITLALFNAVWRSPNLCLNLQMANSEQQVYTPFLVVSNNHYDTEVGKLFNRTHFDAEILGLYYAHKISRWNLLQMGMKAFFNWKFNQITDLVTDEAQHITVGSRAKQHSVALDGEVLKMDTPLKFAVMPKALTVLLPVAPMADTNQTAE